MNKGVKKIKIKKGKDSNRSIVKKMLKNFILRGKITTTLKRAKILQSQIDRLVRYAIRNNQADKNQLLKKLTDKNLISKLVNQAVPVLKSRNSGFTRIIKVGFRLGDGASLAKVEWVEKVELEKPKVEKDKKNIDKSKSEETKNTEEVKTSINEEKAEKKTTREKKSSQ